MASTLAAADPVFAPDPVDLSLVWAAGRPVRPHLRAAGDFALEAAAGEDPVALRRRYGKDLLLVGGIDKRALAKDRRDIEREVLAKAPFLLEHGGWIPSIDHAVPPDVPLENYRYYLSLLRKLAGSP